MVDEKTQIETPEAVDATPVQAVSPAGQETVGLPVPEDDQEEQANPFYKEWSFWLLTILVMVLVGVIGFFLVPSINRDFEAEIIVSDQQVKLHVLNLKATKGGFLVFQKDSSGIPDILFQLSSFIVPDHYRDFYVKFEPDETNTLEFYKELATNGTFFVSFYQDEGGDTTFKKGIDNTIVKDSYGKPLQLKFVGGKMIGR